MKPRHKRLLTIFLVGVMVATGITLIATTFRDQLVFFYSPSDVANKDLPAQKTMRVGGMIKEGSVDYQQDSLELRFLVTDHAHDVPIYYQGVLPPMFRDQQGIIAEGKFDKSGFFIADQLLTKHDENYMPPEVARAMENAKK